MRFGRAASKALVTIACFAVGAVALAADDHGNPPTQRKRAGSGQSGGHHHADNSHSVMPGVVAHAHQTPQSISGIGSAVGIHARTRGPQFQPFDGTSGGRRSVSHAHVRQGLTQQGTVTPVLSVGGVSQSWLYGGAPRQSQFLSHHAAHMHGAHNNEWELLNGKLERSGTGNDPEHRDQQRSATPILGILPYYGWGYGPLSLGHDTWGYAPGWHPPAGNQSAYVMHDSSDRLAHPYGGAGPEEVYAARAYVGQPAPLAKNLSQFVVRGQDDFRRENFASAVAYWRQAMRDDPGNGTLALLLAQALFATGRFSDAGAALRQGLLMLPQEQWGVVVGNRNELYPKVGVYSKHLRAGKGRHGKCRLVRAEAPAGIPLRLFGIHAARRCATAACRAPCAERRTHQEAPQSFPSQGRERKGCGKSCAASADQGQVGNAFCPGAAISGQNYGLSYEMRYETWPASALNHPLPEAGSCSGG